MSAEVHNFQSDWRKRIESSPEAKQAKVNLEFHRRKIRQMHEELTSAEVWEKELEKRLHSIEERVKPPLLRLSEQLEESRAVEDSIIEESIHEEDPEKLISLLRRKAIAMDSMDRPQLLGFIKTVLGVRNGFLEKDYNHGVDVMQQIASGVLKHLGRVTINWVEMSTWEADMVRLLVREVEGVPAFIARIMEQFLVRLVNNNNSNENIDRNPSNTLVRTQSTSNQSRSVMTNN